MHYGNIQSISSFTLELASRKNQRLVEQIRKRIGATSLQYQKIADLVDAIGWPIDRLSAQSRDSSSCFQIPYSRDSDVISDG